MIIGRGNLSLRTGASLQRGVSSNKRHFESHTVIRLVVMTYQLTFTLPALIFKILSIILHQPSEPVDLSKGRMK
jgi:hypothetical protein